MSTVLNWNGQDLPEGVRTCGSPSGDIVLEPVDEIPDLTDEEESGIHAALEAVRAGKSVRLEDEGEGRPEPRRVSGVERSLAP
jgi:hypothetical protein